VPERRAGRCPLLRWPSNGGVAQPGRALPSHGRGRRFKSDHLHQTGTAGQPRYLTSRIAALNGGERGRRQHIGSSREHGETRGNRSPRSLRSARAAGVVAEDIGKRRAAPERRARLRATRRPEGRQNRTQSLPGRVPGPESSVGGNCRGGAGRAIGPTVPSGRGPWERSCWVESDRRFESAGSRPILRTMRRLLVIAGLVVVAFAETVNLAIRQEGEPKPVFETVAIDCAGVSPAPEGVAPGPCEYPARPTWVRSGP
jgi:hypothetical protein